MLNNETFLVEHFSLLSVTSYAPSLPGVTCEQTLWPRRNRPPPRRWRTTSQAFPGRSWPTSWKTSTSATVVTTSSDAPTKPSVDIASAPIVSIGLSGNTWVHCVFRLCVFWMNCINVCFINNVFWSAAMDLRNATLALKKRFLKSLHPF